MKRDSRSVEEVMEEDLKAFAKEEGIEGEVQITHSHNGVLIGHMVRKKQSWWRRAGRAIAGFFCFWR